MHIIRPDYWNTHWARLVTLVALSTLLIGGLAYGDSWNDRTRLRFSSPVKVPGATLPAGEYVFELADLKANRHLVRIKNADESKTFAVAQAIPVKRQEAEGTTTLTFNPTVQGAPPALKAWYYPGSQYGHEFIYSADEATAIANRDKTIVLSEDRPHGDMDAAGELQLYGANGERRPWKADEALIEEWHTWTRNSSARARTATNEKESIAPMVDSTGTAQRVSLDDIEDHPGDFTGRTVSIDAEVEKVLGPRLFTIDEPNWADLDGEILVHVPTALAALVRPDDRVTVTGAIKAYAGNELEGEWQWFDREASTADWAQRPVLVATRVAGGTDNRALLIAKEAAAKPADRTPILSLNGATADAVGRRVELGSAQVMRVTPDRGFFVSKGARTIFVRPAPGADADVRAGQQVVIDGFLLSLPPGVTDKTFGSEGTGRRLYVFATEIS